MDFPGGGGVGVCAPFLNLPRGGAEGMRRGCKFFSSVEFICEERLPGHGLQVIERVLEV